ncbi:putative glyoxalase superfamily protein PhnB [Bacilli bacterium PM5-3]|nr:putative glyoxalase superfamily protein PhnB [Bacilli bacterium PM5-3]MDH6604154.1 putative glyoxalase superfamily protein PhnB [Bacilli bacterium PM5-9]
MNINYDLVDESFPFAKSYIEYKFPYSTPTKEDIIKNLDDIKPHLKLNSLEFNSLKEKIIANQTIRLDEGGSVILHDKSKPWYMSVRAERGTNRYDAYENFLIHEYKYPKKVVTKIGDTADKIMDKIGDPQIQGKFNKKGLVIGDVQSGKTSNFIALVNKAIDSGYNLIVVATGTIERLRKQTQERVELGLGITTTGKNTSKNYRDSEKDLAVHFITNIESDFKLKNANLSEINDKISQVAIIKKNKNTLDNLRKWLQKHNGKNIDKAILFIDDEADNASINTKNADSPTTINQGIRAILDMFIRSSYVGFTATPYANILIDPKIGNDLFPSDFITILDTPSNYIGPNKIFGENGEYSDIIQLNNDCGKVIKSKMRSYDKEIINIKDYMDYNDDIPMSLKEAIVVFLLQNAIRDIRGDKKSHRSMLINVSHLNEIQERVLEYVKEYLYELKRTIKNYSLVNDNIEMKKIEKVFDEKFKENKEIKLDFSDVKKVLYKSVDPIIVEVINSKNSNFRYDEYEEYGARIIAIGGFALSRGLTLEGLSTSYIHRNTAIYDTCMQMGRWFGYRTGYSDLIYLYLPQESVDWYKDILEATNDLKRQIRSMRNEHKSPRDFGLYIKNASLNANEINLIVTARNKMKNSIKENVQISISGEVKETRKLNLNTVDENREIVENWILDNFECYEKNDLKKKGLVMKNVAKEKIQTLLNDYNFGIGNKINSMVIEKTLERYELYDVAIATGESKKISFGGLEINPRLRSFFIKDEEDLLIFKNSRLGSIDDGKYGLTNEEYEEIERKVIKFDSQKSYFDNNIRKNPLIVIYPINLNLSGKNISECDKEYYNENKERLFIGISLGVPLIDGKETVSYSIQMNKILFEQYGIDGDIDIDEFEEDFN